MRVPSRQVTLFLSFLTLSSAYATGLNPEELVGEYLGKGSCGVRVEIYKENQLKFSIVKVGEETVSDTVPFYKMETVSGDDDSFSFESEFFGERGEELKTVAGKIENGRLNEINIKRRRGLFSYINAKCRDLLPLAPNFVN